MPVSGNLDLMPQASQPRAEAAARPLITPRDLGFLIYYYPVRWLALLFGVRALSLVRLFAEPVYQFLPARSLRSAERRMIRMLHVPSGMARHLARRFMSNRLRAALFDLRPDAGSALSTSVRILGREHLERALAAGRGVIVTELHCLAKLEARAGLQRIGIHLRPVVHGGPRDFPGHGRLLWRFARSRLVPLHFKKVGPHIVATDPGAPLEILRVLRESGIVVISSDVASSPSAQPARFLNAALFVSTGALDIARLTGCALLPMWVSYSGRECVVEFRPELDLCFGSEDARTRNLAALVRAMEQQVCAHPDQWEYWNMSRREFSREGR